MINLTNYKFRVSITDIPYPDKDLTSAMMVEKPDTLINGVTAGDIKKKYGLNPRRGIRYGEIVTTLTDFGICLVSGYGYASCFDIPRWRTDTVTGKKVCMGKKREILLGQETETFSMSGKSEIYFRESHVIAIDIDDCSYNPRQFIGSLSRRPNFWYTTYSNRAVKNGIQNSYRFRLIYVFFMPFDDYYFYRYAVENLIDIITSECGCYLNSPIDRCSKVASQTFWGTYIDNLNLVEQDCQMIYPDSLYTLADFPEIDYLGYIDYLRNGCNYAEYFDREGMFFRRAQLIEEALHSGEPVNLDRIHELTEYIPDEYTNEKNNGTAISLGASEKLLEDFMNCKKKEQWYYLRQNYSYAFRDKNRRYISSTDWLEMDGYHYMKMPEDYFYSWNYITRKNGGNPENYIFKKGCRLKSIYRFIIQTRILNPDVSYDTMLIWLADFFYEHIDNSDGDIKKKQLIKRLNKILLKPDLTVQYKGKIRNWHELTIEKHPNQEYIFLEPIEISVKNKIVAKLRELERTPLMDYRLSGTENQRILEEKGIKVTSRTIQKQLKESKEKYREEWSKKLDISKGWKWNLNNLLPSYPDLTEMKIKGMLKKLRNKT